MNEASLAITVIQGWLECMAVGAAGMVTWRVRFDTKRLILLGIAGTVAAQLVRALPLRFGLHTIVMMFVILALMYYLFRPPFFTASCATFFGFTLLILSDEIVGLYILRGLGIHLGDMLADLSLRVVYGLVGPVALTVYSLIVVGVRSILGRRSADESHQGP